MLYTNLKAVENTHKYLIANNHINANKVSFKGASFEPMRPEIIQAKIDNSLIMAQEAGQTEKHSFLRKVFGPLYDKVVNALANNSQEFIEIEQTSGLPLEYRLNYYA